MKRLRGLAYRVLDWLFVHEVIDGHGRRAYLHRWVIRRSPVGRWSIYLHHFVASDWSLDMHDHPKPFLSIGLAGGYVEETPGRSRSFDAPWIRMFSADHVHRLWVDPDRTCWTLVVVGEVEREWGFYNGGDWIHWEKYVSSDLASARVAGPDE